MIRALYTVLSALVLVGCNGDDGNDCGNCEGHSCCGSTCINLSNDILNCGTCGKICPSDKPFCDNGTCAKPPCGAGTSCGSGETCCDSACCTVGKLCCFVPGPVGPTPATCTDPIDGTCPMGCVTCTCLSPLTPIATPGGPVPVALIGEGDLVYSVHGAGIRAVPVRLVRQTPVTGHSVLRVWLDNGQPIEVSGGHPTADGRTFDRLRAGDLLGNVAITAIRPVPYAHGYTYDILPDSDSGTYFAGGALIGSTFATR